MPQLTSPPAQIVADTIVRTVELGVRIVDAAITSETTVLWCELLVEGPGRCPGCGTVGVYRDAVERRVTDVPVVGHPLELRVRVPRYRCVHDAAPVRSSPTTPAGSPALAPRPRGGARRSSCAD
jgi:transposase